LNVPFLSAGQDRYHPQHITLPSGIFGTLAQLPRILKESSRPLLPRQARQESQLFSSGIPFFTVYTEQQQPAIMTFAQAFDGLVKRAKGAPPDPTAIRENVDVQRYLGHVWWSIVAAFTIYQTALICSRYIRTVACLGNETQRYFATPNIWYARFKKSCLDAPLFRTRHHREYKLSSAIGVGTLPSRLQTFFLVGYFAVNVGFCIWKIDYSNYSKGANELISRAGIMAVINMIPLFVLAGRNNPIIKLTGISFDTMNLVHRWFGRIVVLEAVAHTAAWMSNKVHTSKLRYVHPLEIRANNFRGLGCRTDIDNSHPLHHFRCCGM
jgi:hypothetical protein